MNSEQMWAFKFHREGKGGLQTHISPQLFLLSALGSSSLTVLPFGIFFSGALSAPLQFLGYLGD